MRGRFLQAFALLFATSFVNGQGLTKRTAVPQKDDEIGMAYEYVWGPYTSFGSYSAVRVVIENPLKNDRGVLTVKNGEYKISVPVELPSQSIRSLLVYFPKVEFGEATLTLECDQANIRATLSPGSFENGQYGFIALISDYPSQLAFLQNAPLRDQKTNSQWEASLMQVVSCLPGSAPDRAIGLQGLGAVILAEGAERLTDIEVSAIQKYVLAGGRVVFVGGAVSPILRDPRWADFLPGTDPEVRNLDGSLILSKLCGQSLSGELTVTSLKPVIGAFARTEQGVAMTISKACGLGESIYWAFDPFQNPVRDLKGRSRLFATIFTDDPSSDDDFLLSKGAVAQYIDAPYWGRDFQPGGAFQVVMPQTSTIFWILAAYFVVVVPINFFVLARLKKGHLAWVTSPLIGLAFASVFFFIARGLYANSLSRATSAVVFAHQGVDAAYAVGNQKLFFPSGGRYDLGLKDVEVMTSSSLIGYGMYGSGDDTGFVNDTFDVGEVIAPEARVSNLAYREVYFRQGVAFPYRLPIEVELTKNKNSYPIKGTLFNDSPYTLSPATLYVGGRTFVIPDSKPGQTVSFEGLTSIRTRSEQFREQYSPNAMEPVFSSHYAGVTLVAQASGLTVGSNIGKQEGQAPVLVFSYEGVSGEAKGK